MSRDLILITSMALHGFALEWSVLDKMDKTLTLLDGVRMYALKVFLSQYSPCLRLFCSCTNNGVLRDASPLVVLGTGIEPARPCGHQILSLMRLPIPPPEHLGKVRLCRALAGLSTAWRLSFVWTVG